MMMDVVKEIMFDNAYLDQADSHVDRCNSHAISMQGNRVIINGTVIQGADIESTDELVLTLEGSYDGQVWKTSGLGSLTFDLSGTDGPPDNKASSTAIDDVDYAFLRLRAN